MLLLSFCQTDTIYDDRPHRRYYVRIDAVYCYRPSSVVCRTVCLSLRLNRSTCRLDCDLGMAQGIIKEIGVPIPTRRAIWGKRSPIVKYRDFLPFRLWNRVGRRRKHEFNRICQMAPMCRISITFARWRQCTPHDILP